MTRVVWTQWLHLSRQNGPEPALRPQGQPTQLTSTRLNSITLQNQAGSPIVNLQAVFGSCLGSPIAQAGWVAPNQARAHINSSAARDSHKRVSVPRRCSVCKSCQTLSAVSSSSHQLVKSSYHRDIPQSFQTLPNQSGNIKVTLHLQVQ